VDQCGEQMIRADTNRCMPQQFRNSSPQRFITNIQIDLPASLGVIIAELLRYCLLLL
jgi:hypothetical protein